MGVPRAARAVAAEYFGEAVDVFGEVRERDGAILDERHRLAVAAQAHHDIEARLPHVPQRLLLGGERDLDQMPLEPVVGQHILEVVEPAQCRRPHRRP
jgi:hypothetical protein